MPGRLAIPPDIVSKMFQSLYQVRVPFAVSDRAYKRWKHGRPATPCRFGSMKQQARALDCTCEGCIEKLCYLYFDQVVAKFGVME